MRPITVSVGNLVTAASATAVRTATIAPAGDLVLNGAAVAGGIATLDADRNLLVTFAGAEPGLRLFIQGTNTRGDTVSETILGPGGAGTVLSTNSYRRIASISANQATVGAVSIGTSATGTSAWVAFDPWSPSSYIAIQGNVAGTANYTIQSTLDNPNDVNSPLYNNPTAVTWLPSSDAAAVGASTSIQSNFMFVPQYARVLLNSGTGLATVTFTQAGVP